MFQPLRRSRISIRRPIAAAAVGVAMAAALSVVGAGPALAATLPTSPLIRVVDAPVPASPPSGVGDAIPRLTGTLGNPIQIFVSGTSGSRQVVTIPGGSTAWETPARTAAALSPAASTGQTWRLQRVGYVGVTTAMTSRIVDQLPMFYPSDIKMGMYVYKIVQYGPNGTVQCLDALGGSGSPGTPVGLYRCDPGGASQPNQLWTISHTTHQAPLLDPATGAIFVTGGHEKAFPQWSTTRLQDDPNPTSWGFTGSARSVIQNVASLQEKNWNASTAPVLSAAADPAGFGSALTLQAQDASAVGRGNSTWVIHDIAQNIVNNAGPDYPGPTPICSNLVCSA